MHRASARLSKRLDGHLPFLAFLLLFVVCIAGGTAYTLERLRREAISFHTEVSAMHARASEDQLTQSLNVVDLMLSSVVTDDTFDLAPTSLGARFQAELRRVPLLRSLSLLDEQGRIVASSNPRNLGLVVAVDGYLPPVTAASNPGGFLRIGVPWSGRDFDSAYPVSAQKPAQERAPGFIPVSRALHLNGRSLTLLGAINPDYFQNLFDQKLKPGQGVIEVERYDGIMLLSTRQHEATGQLHRDAAFAKMAADVEFDAYEQATGDDGAPTLSAFRVSRLFPLVVIAHLDRAYALQAWRTERQRLLWLIVPALVVVVLVSGLIYRRERRITRQHAMAQQGERQRVAALLSTLPANLLMLDSTGHVVMVNAAWSRFLTRAGLALADDGLGQKYLDICARFYVGCGDPDHPIARGFSRLLHGQGEPFDHMYEVDLPSGRRWFQLSAHPLREPGLRGAVVMQLDITERKAAEQALAEFNRNFESFLGQTSDFIYFKDQDGRFRFCSQTMASITGHAHWHDMLGKTDQDVFPPDTARVYQDEEQPIIRDGKPLLNKIDPYYDAQGNAGFVQTNKWPLFGDDGAVVGIFGISRDISEQRRNEARLQLAASVFTHAREAIMITDDQGCIIDVNTTFTRITGYPREEVLGQNPRMLKSGRHPPEHYAAMWQELRTHGHWTGEIWNRRKNGEVYAEMQTISAVTDAAGQTQNYVSLFSDITSMKEHQRQLEHIAHYDALTNLPNRVLLADRLHQAMAQSQRRGRSLALVFLDLDHFKDVNDTYGHDVGDELLIIVSQRMKAALREGDTLARIGGDEFVAVLVDLDRAQDCEPVLERLLQAAANPVNVGDAQLQVSASMGVTLYPQDGAEADLLMRHADQAMYVAKQAGRNRCHLFDVKQDAAIQTQRESLEHIRNALGQEEFVLYYQPKVNMKTGAVIGAEALIRWRHPERGLLAPATFLPIIEDHPISVTMGEWVIATALRQMDRWRVMGLNMPVSVNICARQLQQADFVTNLHDLLATWPEVEPDHLELEILETSALEDMAKVSDVMHACQALGVRFSLDDFGTGYSSLSYLKRLPAEVLKIDQSFVRDILVDPDDLALVKGIIGLAGAFRRDVIAEGVETAAHGAQLLSLGCELAQGYGIARPMPAGELPDWVSAWQAHARWTA